MNPCKIFYSFLFFSILSFHACSVYANDVVNISGTSPDMKDNSISVRLIKSFFHDSNINYLASQRNQTGEFSLNFKLNKPQLLIFSAFYKNWFVNINPGDSVTFKITGKDMDQRLEFFGKDAVRYNFDVLVSQEMDKAPRKKNTQSLIEYKTLFDEWKKDSERAINVYLKNYKIDKHIADAGKNTLAYSYLRSIYYNASVNRQQPIPLEYFSIAEKYKFKDDNLLLLNEYRSAIHFKYIADIPNEVEQPLAYLYKRIESSLDGKTRDFALALLAGEYSRKGTIKDSLMLRQIFDQLNSKTLDSNYRSYLKDSEMRYFIVGKPLPANVLDSTLLTAYGKGDLLSLSQLLAPYKGKAIYLDLWASWCSPCRSDIAASSEVKKFLMEKDIQVVYFSTDRDEAAWKKASEDDKITDNQFRFKTDAANLLTAFIGTEGIPRYVFLDKDHKVKTLYAPRPYVANMKEFSKMVSELSSR
ncbi:MAG: TlpA family protein disulfide reductase [Pedobacter sp.]|nr:MAG: TlpA family protein disulfide reductase [Pedobacter sp.]